MNWNWQQSEWPHFTYNKAKLEENEATFLHHSGAIFGAEKHLSDQDRNLLIVDAMSDEALKTSEIEGEYLNRESIQSSIRRNLGMDPNDHKIPLPEQGVAEMVVDLYRTFESPLSHECLFRWHTMMTKGRRDLEDIGKYRTHKERMQVISGPIHNPIVHFEAPPSKEMMPQMMAFINWFNDSTPKGVSPLPALTRAGIAHLYFICIHPFEDGNGRIGRAISEKSLSQNLNHHTLIALSHTIQNNRKDYYDALSRNNKTIEITDWLLYFSKTVLDAQTYTQKLVEFLIKKAKFYEKIKCQLNPRQNKVITRMFLEGIKGFQGGLSAENYRSISKTSRATATRDLKDLTDKGILVKTGELKSTRYQFDFIN